MSDAGAMTSDLFPLVAARMVRVSEPAEGQKWQEELIKQLTGGEPMKVRRLVGGWLDFEPDFSSRDSNATDCGQKDPTR